MQAKYTVLHIEQQYALQSKPVSVTGDVYQKVLVTGVKLLVADTKGTELTLNFPDNPRVNVGDEISVSRYPDSRDFFVVQNFTQKQQIADFIAKHRQK